MVVTPSWDAVIACAERLALNHTPRLGSRAMDIMHVASALQLEVAEFLSFDENQRRLALAEGLIAVP